MASSQDLERLSDVAAKMVNVQHTSEDVKVDAVAMQIHFLHRGGNTEGKAAVTTERWEDVSPSWKGRYRKLAREAISRR